MPGHRSHATGQKMGPPEATRTASASRHGAMLGGCSGPTLKPSWVESMVFTPHKDVHSVGCALGGRPKPQREEPGVSQMGLL